jgi:hypothetical protein
MSLMRLNRGTAAVRHQQPAGSDRNLKAAFATKKIQSSLFLTGH